MDIRGERYLAAACDDRADGDVRSVIVIGASAGGMTAIRTVLKKLTHDIPAAIVVLMHGRATSRFDQVAWWRQFGSVAMVKACAGDRLHEGTVFVAPAGTSVRVVAGHLLVESLTARLPSPPNTVNQLFASAAQAYGDRVIGVVLSGLLDDGAHGLCAVQAAGGLTIIQNPDEAEHDGMPRSALARVPDATFCLDVADIGLTLDLLARRTGQLETGLVSALRHVRERVALLVRLRSRSGRNRDTYDYLSAELTSLRAELRSMETLLPEDQ